MSFKYNLLKEAIITLRDAIGIDNLPIKIRESIITLLTLFNKK
jgi:hypothetical protein